MALNFLVLNGFELVIWFRNKHCHDGRSFVLLYQIPCHGRKSTSTYRIVMGYFTKFVISLDASQYLTVPIVVVLTRAPEEGGKA